MLSNRNPDEWLKACADFGINEDFEAVFVDDKDIEPGCHHGVSLDDDCVDCRAEWGEL